MDNGARGPRGHGAARGQDATRVEIWIRPSVHPGVASRIEGSESTKDSEQDVGLRALSTSDVSAASNPHTLTCSPCVQIRCLHLNH